MRHITLVIKYANLFHFVSSLSPSELLFLTDHINHTIFMICRNDGKRPDGLTLMPWANGRCLLWDFTCSHTLTASFLNRAVLGPSNVACDAEKRKICKYSSL